MGASACMFAKTCNNQIANQTSNSDYKSLCCNFSHRRSHAEVKDHANVRQRCRRGVWRGDSLRAGLQFPLLSNPGRLTRGRRRCILSLELEWQRPGRRRSWATPAPSNSTSPLPFFLDASNRFKQTFCSRSTDIYSRRVGA